MNAIDVNLYNYLDDKWRSQYDSWSNNPAGYGSFADVMASTAEGQFYLDQLMSTGAISASMYTVDPTTQAAADGAAQADSAASSASADQAASGETAVASPAIDNCFSFLNDDWLAVNPDKAELLGREPEMAAFLLDNPEWASLFVNGRVDVSASVCGVYEKAVYGDSYNGGQLDVTA